MTSVGRRRIGLGPALHQAPEFSDEVGGGGGRIHGENPTLLFDSAPTTPPRPLPASRPPLPLSAPASAPYLPSHEKEAAPP